MPTSISASSCSSCLYFFYCYGDHRDLHSFPTRRSSDLWFGIALPCLLLNYFGQGALLLKDPAAAVNRSEEHTSELQSPYDLVCRLLLEKKNLRVVLVKVRASLIAVSFFAQLKSDAEPVA